MLYLALLLAATLQLSRPRSVQLVAVHDINNRLILGKHVLFYRLLASEAEASTVCYALQIQERQVYLVASEDMDSLTFEAPRFLRHLVDPSSRKIPVMGFKIPKVARGPSGIAKRTMGFEGLTKGTSHLK
ncbi:unnamed protein product [Dovyalis caffra]|uniref:XPG-I domain-containing protein n=1 Tax=Dovyalis caffra TaxID=77055 RepID=A0AAV1RY86_9ROSI|nr:unnamed protein product [Dovyalis caffra]